MSAYWRLQLAGSSVQNKLNIKRISRCHSISLKHKRECQYQLPSTKNTEGGKERCFTQFTTQRLNYYQFFPQQRLRYLPEIFLELLRKNYCAKVKVGFSEKFTHRFFDDLSFQLQSMNQFVNGSSCSAPGEHDQVIWPSVNALLDDVTTKIVIMRMSKGDNFSYNNPGGRTPLFAFNEDLLLRRCGFV